MSVILQALNPNRPLEDCRREMDRRKQTWRWTAGEGDKARTETIRSATTRHLFYLLRATVRKARERGTALFKRVPTFRDQPTRLICETNGAWVILMALDEIQIRGDLDRPLVTELNQLLPQFLDNEALLNLRRLLIVTPNEPRVATRLELDLSRASRDPMFPPSWGAMANDQADALAYLMGSPPTPKAEDTKPKESKEIKELTTIGRRKIQTD